MIWIILSFVLFVVFLIGQLREDDNYNIGWWTGIIFSGILLLFLLPGFICTGVQTYPTMKSKLQEIETLQIEIETIRQAHYSNIESGTLIGGAIDNQGQSVALTNYLIEYAQKKASYNSNLERYKIYKMQKIHHWIGYGMFIPKEINELEAL